MKQCPECGSELGLEGCPECLEQPERTRPRYYRARLGILAGCLLLVATLPIYLEAVGAGQEAECKGNLTQIGAAFELHARDHGDRYPSSLDLLTPKYLSRVPTCPSAGCDNYSFVQDGAVYTIFCSGLRHHKLD